MRLAMIGIGGAVLLCACSSPEPASSAAPPTVVCGTTISNSPSGAVVEDASTHSLTVPGPSGGDLVYLQVSDDCDHGVTPTFPAAAATVITAAKAKDGALAAIVLKPLRTTFDVQVGDHVVKIRLAADEIGR